jgi:formylglycine-generating enzyme required for sulfatase activity
MPVIFLCFSAFTNINTGFSASEVFASVTTKKLHEPEPYGMAYIPSGSFVLNRTDGTTTKSFKVSIEAFWMYQTEVSIKDYSEYTESVRADSVNQVYEAALPDKSKAPVEDYFSNKKYIEYPVVGISFQQATDFCKWKTRIENQKLKAKGKPPVQNYRIPTEVEWVYSSFGGMDPNKIKLPAINGLVRPSKSVPNEWGLYNMFDNVSEWTYTSFDPEKYLTDLQTNPLKSSTKIIVVGNNYKKSAAKDKLILNGADSYDYVGFRYVRSYMGPKYGKQ